mmetsp:Transcript_22486/g.48900  ORF Transcript_22486/g.48900 Transcript_22486/m.48900 type:complete len:83 (-) Transcript_22486:457-705(-)
MFNASIKSTSTAKCDIKQKLQQTIRKMNPAGRSTWSSSAIKTTRAYKLLGGTNVVTVGSHTGRIKAAGNDIYGRYNSAARFV